MTGNSDTHGSAQKRDLVVLPRHVMNRATALWFLSMFTNLVLVVTLAIIVFSHMGDPNIHHQEFDRKQEQIDNHEERLQELEK